MKPFLTLAVAVGLATAIGHWDCHEISCHRNLIKARFDGEQKRTSTVWTTNIITKTQCPPDVHECPNSGHEATTTQTIPVASTEESSTATTTTKEPSIETSTEIQPPTTSETTTKTTTASNSQATTSTTFTTAIITITSCGPDVPDCPVGSSSVMTHTGPLTTTLAPVTSTEENSKTITPTTKTPGEPEYTTTETPEPTSDKSEEPPTASSHGNYTLTIAPEPVTTGMSTSTIFTTHINTITSCGPEFTDCTAGSASTETNTLPLTTVVSPADSTGAWGTSTSNTPDEPSYTSTSYEVTPTTLPESTATRMTTIYTTHLTTIVSCGPEVPDCPAESTILVTETIATVRPASSDKQGSQTPSTGERPEEPTSTEEKLEEPKTMTEKVGGLERPAKTTELSTDAPVSTTAMGTSTVYTNQRSTVTSCSPGVLDCPSGSSTVVSQALAISTIVFVDTSTPEGKPAAMTMSPQKPSIAENTSGMPPPSSEASLSPVETETACVPGEEACPTGKFEKPSTISDGPALPEETTCLVGENGCPAGQRGNPTITSQTSVAPQEAGCTGGMRDCGPTWTTIEVPTASDFTTPNPSDGFSTSPAAVVQVSGAVTLAVVAAGLVGVLI